MNNPKNNGWISLHRKILQSPIFNKPSEYFKVWIYLLLNVDHQNGTGFFSWNNIKNDCHITNSQLKKCFSFMEKEQMISRKKLPRGVEITILNWDKYQHTQNERPAERPTKAPTTIPTKRPTEKANKISNNADIQGRENLKETNKETNYDTNNETNNETTHNTINTISTISNNIIVSKDTIERDVLDSSLNENEKEKDKETSIESASGELASGEQKVSNKAIYKLVAMFCEEIGLEFKPPHTVDKNSGIAKKLLLSYTIDEIMEAVRYGKEQYIKDKKDPRQWIRNLQAVSNSIESWRGALKAQQEKQQKQEARNYGW